MNPIKKKIKRHLLNKKQSFFYIVPLGWENQAFEELQRIISPESPQIATGGISFREHLDCIVPIHQYCQRGIRLLLRILQTPCLSVKQLENQIKTLKSPYYFSEHARVSLSISLKSSWLYSEKKARDLLTGYINEYHPDIELDDENFSQTLFVRLNHNKLSLSLDLTGAPMYKTNLLPFKNLTPLRENFPACALETIKHYKPRIVFDPFCGSGTLLCQYFFSSHPDDFALMKKREYAYENTPFYDFIDKTISPIEKNGPQNSLLLGQDINEESLNALKLNRKILKHCEISIIRGDSRDIQYSFPADDKILIFSNPPFGWKLEDREISIKLMNQLIALYRKNKNIQLAVFFPNYNKLDNLCPIKINFPYGGKRINFYSTIKK